MNQPQHIGIEHTDENNMISMPNNQNSQSSAPERSIWYQWLSEHGSRLLLYARQQTRSAQDAEDVMQEALVKLARMVDEGTFVGGQEQWKPFIYTSIRRLAIDLARKSDRRALREEKSEADRDHLPRGVFGFIGFRNMVLGYCSTLASRHARHRMRKM